jgi:hypothetical protein
MQALLASPERLSGIGVLRWVSVLQVNLCNVAILMHGTTLFIDLALFECYQFAANPTPVSAMGGYHEATSKGEYHLKHKRSRPIRGWGGV